MIPGILSADTLAAAPPPWQGKLHRRFFDGSNHNGFYLQNGGMLNLQSKRGCSFSCLYCPYPRIEGRQHRLTDPHEVALTARRLQELGAKYFFITDSAFNSDVQHSLEVAAAFRSAGVSIPWGAFLHQ